jgi:glycosyltransferase involved in cell wall biosynthesis
MTSSSTRPLVSWGIPVYNGARTFPEALKSLAAQDYSPLEIIISDNASTDDTGSMCREFAQQHSHVKYIRQTENIGPTRNFRSVLDLARGEYFLWGAHDDFWEPNYVTALVSALTQKPDAILVTPRIKHVNPDRSQSKHQDDRPALGQTRLENLARLYEDHACSWIYGLFRRDWLLGHFDQVRNIYGGDLIWMVESLLSSTITGTDETCLYKRVGKNGFVPTSELEHLRKWRVLYQGLMSACDNCALTDIEKQQARKLTNDYAYRKAIHRKNPFKFMKRLAMGTWLKMTESIPVTQHDAHLNLQVQSPRKAA